MISLRITSVALFLASAALSWGQRPEGAPTSSSSQSASADAVSIKAGNEVIDVTYQGAPVLKYVLKRPADSKCVSPSACYFHPLTTPSGMTVTDVAPDDHLHHRGVFLAWLDVRGPGGEGDFWGWGKYAPVEDRTIVHRDIHSIKATSTSAAFAARNEWQAASVPLLEETLQTEITFREDVRIYDLNYQHRSKSGLTLGQHAFSGFSVRLRKDAPLTAYDPSGKVTLPPPSHLKPETDWPDRPWYAFEMELASGQKAGVAVINHPSNAPTTWHNVTKIGLINPCIIAPSAVELKGGKALVSRYRVVTFDGPVLAEVLNTLAGEYSKK